MERVKNN